MGPGLRGGPASASAALAGAGTTSVGCVTPKSSLRSTAVATSWWTVSRAKAPRAKGYDGRSVS